MTTNDTGANNVLIAIDPSINSLGYAVFINGYLSTHGTIKAPTESKSEDLAYRVMDTMARLAVKLPNRSSSKLVMVIEEPQMFQTTRSEAAVFNNSLKKLLLMVGALVWHGFLLLADVNLVSVSRWKGNLPKERTKADMEQKYDKKFTTNDESDAVGLGDWWLTHQQLVSTH